MSVFKRAWLYISRKRVRAIFLLLILVSLFTFTFVGISIYNSANRKTDNIIQTFGSSFTIKTNPVSESEVPELWEYVPGIDVPRYIGPRIDDAMLNSILALPEISDYTSSITTIDLVFPDISLIPGGWTRDYEEFSQPGVQEDPNYLPVERLRVYAHTCHTIYTIDSSLHEYFRQGAFDLVSGRHLRNGDINKVVISETLADNNHLKVGDTITASCNGLYYWPKPDETKTYGTIDFEIVGLFRVNFKTEPSIFTLENQIAENFVFANYETVQNMKEIYGLENAHFTGYANITFITRDPRELDSVIRKLQNSNSINWKYYSIEKDDFMYNSLITPIEKIKTGYTTISMFLTVGCAVILFLVLLMWAKTRRREIGILLSLGISKGKIIAQSLLECFIIGVIAIILSITVSSAVLPFVEQSVDAQGGENDYKVTWSDDKGVQLIQTEYANVTFSVTATDSDIFYAILVGSCIMAGSIIVAVIPLVNQKPKDVLCSES